MPVSSTEETMHGAAGATVLIADDRRDDRCLLRLILERMGHRVIEACNGEQALALATQHVPDLVISDVLMPVMDGFALRRGLQESEALRHIPFVLVTAAYAESRYQELAAQWGAMRTLLKPFQAQALREVVDEALSHGVYPRAAL